MTTEDIQPWKLATSWSYGQVSWEVPCYHCFEHSASVDHSARQALGSHPSDQMQTQQPPASLKLLLTTPDITLNVMTKVRGQQSVELSCMSEAK